MTTLPRAQAAPPARTHRRRRCSRRQPAQTQPGSSSCRPCSPGPGRGQGRDGCGPVRQAQAPGQGGRQDQPGIGHQAAVVEGDLDPVGVVAMRSAPGLGAMKLWPYPTTLPGVGTAMWSDSHPTIGEGWPASTILAGSPPRLGPVAEQRWCGSWGRQTPG